MFDIPAFAGTVRVMAVAWSKDKVGKAAGDVVVRDPVVLTATLPRFLRTGDRGAVQLELDNVEGAAGDYNIAVSSEGPVKLDGDKPFTLKLAAKQRDRVAVPVSASGSGTSTVKVSVSGPNGFALERAYALNVRPANQILTRRTVRALAPGETLTLSKDMFADFVPGTGRVGLSVAISASLDIATLLNELDRYPFGCSEQITSRAVAMLYVNELAAQAKLALDGDIDARIKDAIQRLLARQDSNGSFGLWSVGGNDPWLDAYVTDFLTRARERKFEVPQAAFTLALDRLRNTVASNPDPSKNGGRDLAYALYVLARNGAAPIGDLRYIADTKLNDLTTPIAKAQVAAALAMLGDKARADRVYLAALDAISPQPKLDLGRADYGSALRDSAALVTLASEGRATQRTIDDAVARIDAARALTSQTSTQEDAWLVLAARALAKQLNAISLSVNGEARQGTFYRSLRADELDQPLAVSNSGDGTVQAVVSVSGSPLTPEPAAERGFKIERSYFTLDGEPANPTNAKQNQRFVVVLKMTEPQPQFGRVIVADYLPAGFEIDNPRLVSSGDTGTLSWITDAAEPVNSEFRDDRFTAAFDRKAGFAAGVHRGLCGARGIARPLRAAAGGGRGHVPARPLRPHRHRRNRHHGGQMKRLAVHPGEPCRRGFSGRAGRRRLGVFARTAAARQGSRNLAYRARSRGQAAARLCHQRGPLAAAGDREGRRSAVSQVAVRLRGQALLRARRRRSAGARPRRLPIRHQRPHRLRRLDFDHAGRPPVGAARASQPRRQAAPDHARARARTCAEQEPRFCRFI